MSGNLLLIYVCNFHVLSHLLLIYIDGSAALVLGVINQYVTAGEESRRKLLKFVEDCGPLLKTHGPVIAEALEKNCQILKNITGSILKEIPDSPQKLGEVLGNIVKADIIPKETVERILDTMKKLHLADEKGIKPELVLTTFTTIATVLTGTIGGTIAGTIGGTIAAHMAAKAK